ncbi:MAG TPA: 1,4-dihydroxy-2-naphthoate polyprenyltransferase [Acidimicrobiales bacterium]|nr:1,4-dihydroxy-2-naphthoate polyprenyltransferase [Acidimicrobiales bacterium]
MGPTADHRDAHRWAAHRWVANRWVVGARPRTLPAALSPVLVGTAVAGGGGAVWAWRAAAALVVALALQVAVNYANDYQDGLRGTDADRVGPTRLVATGLATAASVRRAALLSAAVAGVAGLALAAAVQPWLILVGAVCMVAAWAYTGGPHPYGYVGFGELFVFLFFGVVAVTGSAYVEQGHLSALALGASVPVGLLATALLVVNNLRDRVGDAASGKRTLAVRLGERPTRLAYALLVVGALVSVVGLAVAATPWALLALVVTPLAVAPVRRVLSGAAGPDLVAVLGETGKLQLAFAIALSAGLWAR